MIVQYLNHCNRNVSNVKTVLDFGCGTGVLGDHIRRHCKGITVTSYDPSIPGLDKIPKGNFDAIISVDVLEHVEPGDIAETLEWMRTHTLRQLHHIDCNDTKDRLPDGRDVHLIIKEPEWWEVQVCPPACGFQIMQKHVHDKFKKGRFRRSCTFIIERQG